MMADDVRVVAFGEHLTDTGAPVAAYAWPTPVRCGSCRYAIEVVVLADDVRPSTRARSIRALDDYLEQQGWRPRHGGNDLCPECRATDEEVRKQVDALTAPGSGYGPGGQPGDAAISDELDKLTAQPSAMAALDDDEDAPTGDAAIREEIAKVSSPWTCPTCDGENDPKAQTCKRCGSPRPKDEASEPDEVDEDQWTCPVCGAGNDQDDDTCELCGNERMDTTP